MTNERMHGLEQVDIAILGAGPAGLQAALVLPRTRKRIIVFDDPEPPRNAASHGVHNFLGVDGLLPKEIRKNAWNQIQKYRSAELRREKIVNIHKEEDGMFVINNDNNKTSVKAK
jgi:thioredoxin reductase